MKKLREYYKWIIAFVFCVAVIAVYKTFDNIGNIGRVIGTLLSALKPFFIGFVIAYLLNLPSKKLTQLLQKIKLKKISDHSYGISVLLVYIITIALRALAVRSFVPALSKNIIDLSLNLPNYVENVLKWLGSLEIVQKFNLIDLQEPDAMNTIYSFLGKVDPYAIGKYIQGVFNVTSELISLFIALISSVYMLLDKERILSSLKRMADIFLTPERSKSALAHARRINSVFTSYIYCRMVCSLVMAVVCSVALSLMRVEYAVILGLFIGAMDMIPYFGSIFSVIIAEIVILITGGMWQTIWTTVTLLVLQQLDGNVLAPKIMGMSLDIRPLWIIVAVSVGGSLFGVPGMLLSVPVAAVIRAIAADYVDEYARKKELKKQGGTDE